MKKLFYIILIVLSITEFACHSNSAANIPTNNTSPGVSSSGTSAIAGKQLFNTNCAQCHRPDEDLTGPALKDVAKRWEKQELLYEFVHNPQQVIAKDPYAKQLFNKWNGAYMQPFPQLTKEEIDLILAYCNTTP